MRDGEGHEQNILSIFWRYVGDVLVKVWLFLQRFGAPGDQYFASLGVCRQCFYHRRGCIDAWCEQYRTQVGLWGLG